MNCLIVDDEKPARDLLTEYINKVPELNLVGICANAMEAQMKLVGQDIDLLFLDIQMPHISGMDLLRSLHHPPLIILTTAYSDYAVEAFQYEVVDYLLKPIVFERFFQAIGKTRRRLNTTTTPLISPSSPTPPEDFIFIKADQLIHKIAFSDILYIESLREYIRIHTKDKRIVLRQALSDLLQKLPEQQFTRIHRSYIINLRHIDNIEGNMVRIGDKTLTISKRKKEEFLKLIENKGLIG